MSYSYKDNTEQVLSAMEKAIERGLESIGLTAESYAKKITPFNTGRLRNSITHATEDKAAYVGTNVEYAQFVELGANGRKAHHMLQRAATEHTAEYKRLMEDSIKNA